MPRSKRAKVVHLSKVPKKGKEHTLRLFSNIQAACLKYPYIYVFTVDNMRNNLLKDVREELNDCRLFFGKTKVMAKALGTAPEDSPAECPNIHTLSLHLRGSVGIIFASTSRTPSTFIPWLHSYIQPDFARAGVQANRDFVIPWGVVYSRGGEISAEEDVHVPVQAEPMLRGWGLPTRVERGRVLLEPPPVQDDGTTLPSEKTSEEETGRETEEGHKVCRAGESLTPHQTAALKYFGVQASEFRLRVLAYYDRQHETVETVGAPETPEEEL